MESKRHLPEVADSKAASSSRGSKPTASKKKANTITTFFKTTSTVTATSTVASKGALSYIPRTALKAKSANIVAKQLAANKVVI